MADLHIPIPFKDDLNAIWADYLPPDPSDFFEDAFNYNQHLDQAEVLSLGVAFEEAIEVLIAADPFSSGTLAQLPILEMEDPISIDMGVMVSTTMDISFLFQVAAPTITAEEIVAGYDLFQIADYESSHMPRAPPWDDEYSAPHDISFIFADRNVNVVDTLDVAIDDVSQVGKFETIEGLVAAGYSTFQGDVEPLAPETWDEYIHTSTLDVSAFIATQVPPETIEALVAASYSIFQGDVEFLEAPQLIVEDSSPTTVADITYVFADRNINVTDTLDVAVVDTSQVDKFETIEGLVVANYSSFQGDVEAQSPDTLDEYTHVTTLEVILTPPEPEVEFIFTYGVRIT